MLAAVLLDVSVPLMLAVLEAVPVWVPVGGIVVEGVAYAVQEGLAVLLAVDVGEGVFVDVRVPVVVRLFVPVLEGVVV